MTEASKTNGRHAALDQLSHDELRAFAESRILVHPNKFQRGWPLHEAAPDLVYMRLADAFRTKYKTDAHFTAYYSSEKTCRLSKRSGKDSEDRRGAHERLTRGVLLFFLVIDVDCDAVHGTAEAAPAAWREREQRRVANFATLHPKPVVYQTRGGYRIVLRLRNPFRIQSVDDDDAWKLYYLRSLCYLAREFEIIGDPACSDWTREFRLPWVTRDGKLVEHQVAGDVHSVGMFDYVPEGPSLEDDIRVARTIAKHSRGWRMVVSRLGTSAKAANAVQNRSGAGDFDTLPMSQRRARASAFVARCRPAISGQGGHNQAFGTIIHAVRGFALDEETAFELIASEYNPRCEPPWSDDELRHKIRDALAQDEPPLGAYLRGVARKALLERGDHAELADELVEDLVVVGIRPVFADGRVYSFDVQRGIWLPHDEDYLSKLVKRQAGRMVLRDIGDTVPLKLKASDVAGTVRLAKVEVSDPAFFEEAERGIAFTNGFAVVTQAGVELRPHSPANRVRFAYDFPYNASPKEDLLIRFFSDVFRDDADAIEKVALLQQFAGASLLGIAPRYQQCVALVGPGRNGKSKFTDVILAAMPAGSTTSIPVQSLGNEYYRAELAGKLLNAVNDLPETDIIDSAEFKAVVSGDSIMGRRIYCAPFAFRPIAGHMFSANNLPGTRDQSHGFWRRFVVITFNRVFGEGAPGDNPHVADDIIATEMSGVVSWMLEGAVRVLRHGHYTVPASSEAAKREWRRGADSVAAFCHDETLTASDNSNRTRAKPLYLGYRDYCEENGFRPVHSKKFSQRMKQLGFPVQKGSDTNYYPVTLVRDWTESAKSTEAAKPN